MNPDTKSRSSSGNAKIIDVEEYRKNQGLEIIQEEDNQDEETEQRQYQKSKQFILSVILLSCGTWVVMTLVPTHDLIRYPGYWWEIMVQWCFGNKLMKLIFYSLHCKSVLNYPGISSPKSMLKLFIISAALTITYCCVVHLIWTTYLGYYEPMVYNGWLEGLISHFVLMAALWFLLPRKWRSDPNKRQQMNSYFFYLLFEFTLVYQIFGFLMLIFPKIPKDFKPYGLALFFWPWREAVGFVMSALIKKAASSDKFDEATLNAVGITNIDLSTLYHFQALMLCTNLAHVFGDVFTYCLLSADFVFVLITIARIIRIKRKIRPTRSQNMETKELMYELVVSEIVELLLPILFMITFTITYNGPNANHMEGMLQSYWQQSPVKDLWSHFYPTSFLFLGVDLIVLVSMAIILYFGCNTNLMQEAHKVWMNFGLLITLRVILQWNQVRYCR